MTDRKITFALNKIKACKENGDQLEALLRSYHLNLDLIRYIHRHITPKYSLKGEKTKVLVTTLLKEVDHNPGLKTIIQKRSIKTLKPWLEKMDQFFKSLKTTFPANLSALQLESEGIFGVLKISANKLLVKK